MTYFDVVYLNPKSYQLLCHKFADFWQIERDRIQYPREKMGFRENGSFLANGTTFLTFYTSSKLEKWVFQKMGRLDDREENGTLTNLRESFVTFENRGL